MPFFKSGDQSKPTNYRPISLLPAIGKLFEKLLYKRIYTFLSKNNTYSKSQFGFRSKLSTADAIASLPEVNRANWFKPKNLIKCTFIDLKKAFDTVNHELLLKKCEHYGLRVTVLKMLESYLKDRFQYIKIEKVKSEKKNVKCGVQQGSILGPLLFIIYLNDILTLKSIENQAILYADDTVVSNKGSIETGGKNHDAALAAVANWFHKNKLTINATKTKHMVFGKGCNQKQHKTTINRAEIEQTSSFRYLEIIIDDQLKFKDHINYAKEKLLKFCHLFFYRLRLIFKRTQLHKIFKIYVKPIVQYGILIYGSTNESFLKPINLLIKRILKIIFWKRKYESIERIRVHNLISNASELHAFEIFKLLVKLIKKQPLSEVFSTIIADSDLNDIMKKRNRGQFVKISRQRFDSNSLKCRVLGMLKMALNFNNSFIEDVRTIKEANIQEFCHTFLNLYITGNQYLLDRLFHVH